MLQACKSDEGLRESAQNWSGTNNGALGFFTQRYIIASSLNNSMYSWQTL